MKIVLTINEKATDIVLAERKDKNYKQLCFPYRDVIGIEELLGKSYDLILIAVEKKEIAMEIRKGLLEKGVSDSKIYWCQPDLPF